MDVELVPDLPADLGWSDVLLPVQSVHHIQLLVLDQLSDDFDAVPLRQSEKQIRFGRKQSAGCHSTRLFISVRN